MDPNLLVVCASAFLAVFLLLSFLAVAMRVLIIVAPERSGDGADVAVVAAVASAVSAAYPGSAVTTIEEIQ